MQVSDMLRNYLGNYVKDGGCRVGKGVALEFALFLTVFACALGVAAFLALTLTVEEDRRVSQLHKPPCTHMTTHSAGCGEVQSVPEERGCG